MSNLIALPAGTELVGDYRVERVLGAGGFGITYLADEFALARMVTIKEYFPADFAARDGKTSAAPRSKDSTGDYQWGLDRFIEEAQILAQFTHPNIVRVYRYFKANNTAYMVLHFEEGESFKSWLKGLGRAPRQSELDPLMAALLDALATVHAADFLHRDIAPDNIIIRNDGSPVLIDFGSARGELAGHSKTVSALVKPGYSPYEQYAETSRQQGPWTDIYALSATLYTAICGRRPPDAPSRMVADEYVPVSEAAKGAYRKRFLRAIDRGLRLAIDDRPQSIAEWRGELLGPDTPSKTPEADRGDRAAQPRVHPAESGHDADGRSVPPPPDAPGQPGDMLNFVDGLKADAGAEGPFGPGAVRAAPTHHVFAAGGLDVQSRPPQPQRRPPPGTTPAGDAQKASRQGINAAPSPGTDHVPGSTAKLTSPPVFGFKGIKRRQARGQQPQSAPEPQSDPGSTPGPHPQPSPAGRDAAANSAHVEKKGGLFARRPAPRPDDDDAAPDNPPNGDGWSQAQHQPARSNAGKKSRRWFRGRRSANRASKSEGDKAASAAPEPLDQPGLHGRDARGGHHHGDLENGRKKSRFKDHRSADPGRAKKRARAAAAPSPDAQLPVLRPRQKHRRRWLLTPPIGRKAGFGWLGLSIKLVIGTLIATAAVTYQHRLQVSGQLPFPVTTAPSGAFKDGIILPPAHPRTVAAQNGTLDAARMSTPSTRDSRVASRPQSARQSPPAATPLAATPRDVAGSAPGQVETAALGRSLRDRPSQNQQDTLANIARTPRPGGTAPANDTAQSRFQSRASVTGSTASASASASRSASTPKRASPPQTRSAEARQTLALRSGAQPEIGQSADQTPIAPIVRNPLLKVLTGHEGPVLATALSDDGKLAITSGADATLRLWSLADGTVERVIVLEHGPATALATQKDVIATGHRGGFIAIYDRKTGERRTVLRRNEADVWALRFTPTEGRLAAATHDWKIALWDLGTPGTSPGPLSSSQAPTQAPTHVFEGHENAIFALAISSDGRYLASGGADRRVRLWNLDTLDSVRTFSRQRDFVKAIALSPSGRTIAAANLKGEVTIGRTSRRRLNRRLRGHDDSVTALAFTPDGEILASAGRDGTIRLWDPDKRRTLKTLAGHRGGVNDITISRDGRILLAGDASGALRIWSLEAALN